MQINKNSRYFLLMVQIFFGSSGLCAMPSEQWFEAARVNQKFRYNEQSDSRNFNRSGEHSKESRLPFWMGDERAYKVPPTASSSKVSAAKPSINPTLQSPLQQTKPGVGKSPISVAAGASPQYSLLPGVLVAIAENTKQLAVISSNTSKSSKHRSGKKSGKPSDDSVLEDFFQQAKSERNRSDWGLLAQAALGGTSKDAVHHLDETSVLASMIQNVLNNESPIAAVCELEKVIQEHVKKGGLISPKMKDSLYMQKDRIKKVLFSELRKDNNSDFYGRLKCIYDLLMDIETIMKSGFHPDHWSTDLSKKRNKRITKK